MRQSWKSTRERSKWIGAAAFVLITLPAMAQAVPATEPAERRLVISVPDRKLALIAGGRVVKTYPIAVGADVSPSPTGSFRIVTRITNPTYYHPGKAIRAGKSNPLGSRWMGLDRKSYGIHGTNQPRSIGKAASHGCIRMAHADLEELFEAVRAGDAVEIHGERDEVVAAVFASQPAAAVGAGQPQPADKAAASVSSDTN